MTANLKALYFCFCLVLNVQIISSGDLPETFFIILETDFLTVLHNEGLDFRELVKRDSWENMMFNLVLHATAHVVEDPGVHINVSGGDNLMSDVVMDLIFRFDGLSSKEILLAAEHLFRLMTGSDDPGSDGTTEEDTREPDLPREAEVPGPVDDEEDHFSLSFIGEGPHHRVDLPLEEEDSVQS